MALDKVKVGIVGLGLVGDFHIEAYQAHPDAEVVAVCDLDEARAREVCARYGIGRYYLSYDELLADDAVDTVDITTPTVLHAPMALAAARAGKHILCEKPFCLRLAEGEAVCRAADDAGVTLMVGESYLFMTSIMRARALVQAGAIGKPQQIRQRFGAWVERPGVLDDGRPVTELHRGWRMDTRLAGGAGFPWMFDHCVHFFATAEYLMNDARIDQVYALRSQLDWTRAAEPADTGLYRPEAAGDIPIMTWRYADPACTGIWVRAEPLNNKFDPMHGFTLALVGETGMIEVLGEGGAGLHWAGQAVHLVLHRRDGPTETMRFDEGGDAIWQSEVSYYGQAHANQIREFVAALLAGTHPRYGGQDGLRHVRTTMAAIRSAKEGVPIKVDEMTDERFEA